MDTSGDRDFTRMWVGPQHASANRTRSAGPTCTALWLLFTEGYNSITTATINNHTGNMSVKWVIKTKTADCNIELFVRKNSLRESFLLITTEEKHNTVDLRIGKPYILELFSAFLESKGILIKWDEASRKNNAVTYQPDEIAPNEIALMHLHKQLPSRLGITINNVSDPESTSSGKYVFDKLVLTKDELGDCIAVWTETIRDYK